MHTTGQLNAALAGRYEIDRQVGQGGMATVYLARDIRHNRRVALKVLSAELAAVLGRERFLSEIEVTANLQHPHLLPLFDSGEAGGLLFYVMPYIEGETLRTRLEREQQLGVDEAVHIAAAIGSALDYAHRHGVIHRDLKPENVLFHENEPMVMDFGIALAVSNAGGARVTQTGISLGTPQYMSPEQATGDRQIGARSDIYSLGAVTYEMLAGEPPHVGASVQATFAKVITDKPRSLRALRETVPEHVDHAVMRALAKLPADRYATAAEFVQAITERRAVTLADAYALPALAGEVRVLPIARPATLRPTRRALAVGAVAVVAMAAIGAAAASRSNQEAPDTPSRFQVELPDSVFIGNNAYRQVALSRDGSRSAFYFPASYPGPLYTRRTGELHFDIIPGSDSARSAVLSPDGRHALYWLFVANGPPSRLMKIAVAGGLPVKLADSANGLNQASWGDGDQVLFRRNDHLVLMPANGGAERVVARPDTALKQGWLGWPEILPGGKAALIAIHRGPGTDPESLFVGFVSLADGKVVDLNIRGLTPHYAQGHLLYVRQDGQLMAAPFDAARGKVTGEAMVIAKDLSARQIGAGVTHGVTDLAVSETGMILFTDGGSLLTSSGGASGLWLVARRRSGSTFGVAEALTPRQASYLDFRASPDGLRLALTMQDSLNSSREDVWLLTIATNQFMRLTRDGRSSRPVWTADGKRIVFRVTDPAQKPQLRFYSVPWDQSEPPSPVVGADGFEDIEYPRPNGRYVAYVKGDSTATPSELTNSDIVIAPLDSSAAVRSFSAALTRERMPRFSPDGKWLAYIGHELPTTGSTVAEANLYVRPVPGPGGVTQVSITTGNGPVWSSDGRTLYYFGGNRPPGAMIAARISYERGFEVVKRDTVLTRGNPQSLYWQPLARTQTDIMPNGDIVYLTRAQPSMSALAGTAPAIFRANLIAMVNWLGAARAATATSPR